jgi:hypothetical protein
MSCCNSPSETRGVVDDGISLPSSSDQSSSDRSGGSFEYTSEKKKSSKRGDLNLRMLPRARVLIHVLKTASVIARGVTEISPCVDYPEAGLAEENILGCVS